MKKWLIFIMASILLVGAFSSETEVPEDKTENQVNLVLKTNNETTDNVNKEKVEEEQNSKETEEAKKAEEERKQREEERKTREEQARKEAEAKQIAEQAEATVQQLENNQIQENVAPAQAAVDRVTDPTLRTNLTNRIGSVQHDINERVRLEEQQAAEAEQARQAAEQARQAAAAQQAQQQQAFASQPQQGAFRNCREARVAGAAPLYRGQPGYGSHLDRDGDGVACE